MVGLVAGLVLVVVMTKKGGNRHSKVSMGIKKTCYKVAVCMLLSYKVKTQYVQVSNIIDTFSKHPISGKSTPLVKGCMYIFGRYCLQLLKSIDHLLISLGIFQGKRK